MTKTLFASAVLALALPAQAQISLATPASTYSQNFDTLLTTGATNAWVNNSTLAGWSLFNSVGAAIATYATGNGSSITGAFYSFGSSSDRALGGVGSGGTYFGSPASPGLAGHIAVAFTNGSGAVFDSFTLGFDGEQWRNGGNTTAHTTVLEYGFGATFATVATWVAPGGNFDWTSPLATATSAAVNGNVAGLVAGKGGTITTPWAAGNTLWVRWIETNNLGNDHGLAIDNFSFSVTAVPEPGTYALLLAGLGIVGFVARRRRG